MRVAIADRDPEVSGFLKEVVEQMGHSFAHFSSGTQLVTHLPRDTFDLLILSWTLQDGSCSRLLEWAGFNLAVRPAIMVIASAVERGESAAALRAGADDFVVLPEDRDILEARIAALLRRSASRPATEERISCFGRYCFDRQRLSGSLDGRDVTLTSKEFALALLFFENEGRGLSRAYILEAVWKSMAGLPSRTLDMHVSRIRAKLKLRPENGFGLMTVFGYGYRLERFEP